MIYETFKWNVLLPWSKGTAKYLKYRNIKSIDQKLNYENRFNQFCKFYIRLRNYGEILKNFYLDKSAETFSKKQTNYNNLKPNLSLDPNLSFSNWNATKQPEYNTRYFFGS